MGNIEFNGTLVAFDVDVAENLTLIYNRTANGTFELIEIDRNLMDQFVVCGNGLVCEVYISLCSLKLICSVCVAVC